MSPRPHDIEAEVHALPTSEGGRKGAMLSGYRPSHDFGKNGHLNDGMHEYSGGGSIDPGSFGKTLIWLLDPDDNFGLLSIGDSFTVQEGSRIVGHGKISALPNEKLRSRANQLSQPTQASGLRG